MKPIPTLIETHPEAFASLGGMAVLTSWTQAILGATLSTGVAIMLITVTGFYTIHRAAQHWPGEYDE